MTPAPEATTPRGSVSCCSPTIKRAPQTRWKPATEKFPLAREPDRTWVRGQTRLPPRHRGGPTSTRNWLKRASSKPSWRRNTAQCGYFSPPSPEKPPLVANVRASWAGKPASASTSTSTSTIRTLPASEPKAHCCRDTAAGHASSLNTGGAEPAPRSAGAHRAGGRAIG
jgi:hypothetical protein